MRRRKNKTTVSAGLGPLDVVQIVLIILKLIGLIDWSWVAVLIPFWFELCVIVVIVIALFVEYHKNKL